MSIHAMHDPLKSVIAAVLFIGLSNGCIINAMGQGESLAQHSDAIGLGTYATSAQFQSPQISANNQLLPQPDLSKNRGNFTFTHQDFHSEFVDVHQRIFSQTESILVNNIPFGNFLLDQTFRADATHTYPFSITGGVGPPDGVRDGAQVRFSVQNKP